MDNFDKIKEPPLTRRSFGLEVAYRLCDKIKVATGCGICGADDIVAAALEWYDTELQCLASSDVFILAPFNSATDRFAVVCLDCVQATRNVEIPDYKEIADGK